MFAAGSADLVFTLKRWNKALSSQYFLVANIVIWFNSYYCALSLKPVSLSSKCLMVNCVMWEPETESSLRPCLCNPTCMCELCVYINLKPPRIYFQFLKFLSSIALVFKCGILTNSLSFNTAFTEAIFHPLNIQHFQGLMWELKMLSSAERQAHVFNSLQVFSWAVFKDSVNTLLLELQGEFVCSNNCLNKMLAEGFQYLSKSWANSSFLFIGEQW